MEDVIINLGFPAIIFLMSAAFAAGFIDSMAGGGGLISLPAILLVGIPSHIALGTNKFMSSIGTIFSFITYARSQAIVWRVAAVGLLFSFSGSMAGAKSALYLNSEVLGRTIIFLLPIAALLTFMPLSKTKNREKIRGLRLYLLTPLVCAGIGFYDGFFGPGTGSFMLIGLHFILGLNLIKASGTTKALNLASNISSLVVFLLNCKILFLAAVPMAIANIAGNIIGSRMALHHGAPFVRIALQFSLALLFISLIIRYYF